MTASFPSSPPDHPFKLTNYVLIEKDVAGAWKATAWGWTDCEAKGSTRQEALSNLRQVLTARLKQAEIVPLEIDLSDSEHPWLKFAGKYKDDPQFDEILAFIEANRDELDAEMGITPRGLNPEDITI